MRSNRIPILNIEIDNLTKEELLKDLTGGVLITPNVDHLMKLQKDKDFYKLYQKADYITLDSQIVKLALRFLGTPAKELITGSDFLPSFYKYHKDNPSIKIFLLGAAPGVAHVAMHRINKKVNRKIIVGTYSPPFNFEKSEKECNKIIEIINKSDANVLAVGIGAPKQEKWIFKFRNKLSKIKIFMAVGATIDFEANKIQRAPKFIRTIYLEWLFRLIKEPKRLWKRYLIDDIPFIWLIIKQKLNFYKNPFE